MIMDLYYPNIHFHYKVDIWKDEYIEYLWEKEIGKPFNLMDYFLEPLGKETYIRLEKEWIQDKLPLFDIRQSSDFYQFLLNRFEDKAELRYWQKEEEQQMEEDRMKLDLISYINSLNTDKNENYIPLDSEELEEIFLDNFMGEV